MYVLVQFIQYSTRLDNEIEQNPTEKCPKEKYTVRIRNYGGGEEGGGSEVHT